jgi:hypothetical protein
MSNRTSNLPSRVTDVNVIVESGSLGIRHDAAGPREQAREETSSTEPLIPSATNQEFGLHNPDAAACDIQPPTVATYNEFQEAYSYFNESLFDRTLPDCLITLAHQAGSYGYFRCEPFVNRDGERTDEISLNPRFFASRTDRGVLSTLVHEMAHLEQSHFGKPGRTGYHNRQWANKMIHLGLYPSNTGQPGGRETGYSMTHYIVESGPFDITCGRLLSSGFHLSWAEGESIKGNSPPSTSPALTGLVDSSNRWKYTCPRCRNNAWGKPKMRLVCGGCMVAMPRNGGEEDE